MKLLTIIALCFLSSYGHSKGQTKKAPVLAPFSTDGCSRFPNGLGQGEWLNCCELHDIAYWAGVGEASAKEVADHDLHLCLKEQDRDFLSWLIPFGVRAAEGINFTSLVKTPFRWGYGWNVVLGKKQAPPNHLEIIQSQIHTVIPGIQSYRLKNKYPPLTEEQIEKVRKVLTSYF